MCPYILSIVHGFPSSGTRGRAGLGRVGSAASVACLACVLAACSGGTSSTSTSQQEGSAIKPLRVIAAPAGLIAGTAPQPSGILWALAGSATSKNIQIIRLSGSGPGATIVPVGSGAVDVVESSSGLIGMALRTTTTGALQFRNGASGAVVAMVALPSPAMALTAGSDGATFYALCGTSSVRAVTVVSSLGNRITNTIPVPADTVSIAVEPSQQRLFALLSDGTVKVIAVIGGQILSSFTAGPGANRIAISNDGSTLYVLKTAGQAENVGVINVATQRQTGAIPAPANTVDIQVSLDGTQIYDMVGTQRYGNIQVFSTGH